MQNHHYYHISETGEVAHIKTLEEALSLLDAPGYLWFSYVSPSKEELSRLVKPLKLHPLSVKDCMDEDQIPRINEFTENTFVLFNSYHYKESGLLIEEINFFLGVKFLVTVSRSAFAKEHPLHALEEQLRLGMENTRRGPAFLLHIMLDMIVDHQFAAIEAIEDQIVALEDIMMEDILRQKAGNMQQLRRHLLALRKSLFHEREILMKICRRDIRFIEEEAIFHYRNIYDHLTRYFELVEMDREILMSLMQMNLSVINNRMAESANKTNASVRRLTLITTIFMPLSLIAGIGGMSEFTMMTGNQNWALVYPLLLVFMAVMGTVSYFLLKRMEKKDKGD
jgi:magnesium transporter